VSTTARKRNRQATAKKKSAAQETQPKHKEILEKEERGPCYLPPKGPGRNIKKKDGRTPARKKGADGETKDLRATQPSAQKKAREGNGSEPALWRKVKQRRAFARVLAEKSNSLTEPPQNSAWREKQRPARLRGVRRRKVRKKRLRVRQDVSAGEAWANIDRPSPKKKGDKP